MPPLDPFRFPEFPAKQYDAAVTHAWEIDQSARGVFYLDSFLMQFGCQFADPIKSFNIIRAAFHSAAKTGSSGGGGRGVLHFRDLSVKLFDFAKLRSYLCERIISFFDSEQFHPSSL